MWIYVLSSLHRVRSGNPEGIVFRNDRQFRSVISLFLCSGRECFIVFVTESIILKFVQPLMGNCRFISPSFNPHLKVERKVKETKKNTTSLDSFPREVTLDAQEKKKKKQHRRGVVDSKPGCESS